MVLEFFFSGRGVADKKDRADAGALASSKEGWKYYCPDCKKNNVDTFYTPNGQNQASEGIHCRWFVDRDVGSTLKTSGNTPR